MGKGLLGLAVGVMGLVGGAAVVACSDGHSSSPPNGHSAQDLVCVGNVCWDADVPGFDEAGQPIIPDAGIPIPDWSDAGFGGQFFDAGFNYCNWLDPKYYSEYQQAFWSGQVKSCWTGCAASECCYSNLSCVAQ